MEQYKDFSYQLNDQGEIRICRYTGNEETISVPSCILDHPVTIIGRNAFTFTDVEELEVPEGITEIEKEAFGACENLRCISLPRSLRDIGEGAFMGCAVLKQVLFPNGNERFRIQDGVLFDKEESALVLCPPGLHLKEYIVPFGIEVLSAAAFYMNSQLKRVELPPSLKKIGENAFLFTDQLHFITIPPGVEEIHECCFLMMNYPYFEKPFVIYAFKGSAAYRYALDNKIPVEELYFMLND